MSNRRRLAAVIAVLGWLCIVGTCVVGTVTREQVSDEDAVYVIVENATSRTFKSVTIGGNYKTNEHIRQTFEPGERTREYKRGLTVASYSRIMVNFAPKGYARARGIDKLEPGHYVIRLSDAEQSDKLQAEVLRQE
ncbi:MAG: hypothetical protein AAFY60_12390 [Myxococcota bacterium]